ncbi:MAG: multiprotein bridging factor aMBF1 [Candidatus Hodarchaeota archaeon]
MAPECEICGKKAVKLKKVNVEGAIVEACVNCAPLGTLLPSKKILKKQPLKGKTSTGYRIDKKSPRKVTRKAKIPPKDVLDEGKWVLATDYNKLIANARQKMGIKREQLGSLIGERESTIAHIERGDIVPTETQIKKLEKTLKISLKEEVLLAPSLEKTQKNGKRKSKELTLGDIVVIKKHKKSEK